MENSSRFYQRVAMENSSRTYQKNDIENSSLLFCEINFNMHILSWNCWRHIMEMRDSFVLGLLWRYHQRIKRGELFSGVINQDLWQS
jgi:hypothetical protein